MLVRARYGNYFDEVDSDSKPILGRHIAKRIIEADQPIPEEIKKAILFFKNKGIKLD